MMEIVGGDLLSFLDWRHCSTSEGEVVVGKTDGVGGAGMIEDGHDGEQTLEVSVFVGILTDDVGIGVQYSNNVSYLLL